MLLGRGVQNWLKMPPSYVVMLQTTQQAKSPSWYSSFSTLFMKNVLFEQKKLKLWNKWQFVEIETLYSEP